MNKVDLAKKITKFVVGGSASFTVANVIANNTNPKNQLQKAEAIVGGVVIGMMVAEKAETFTDRKIDEIVSWWTTNHSKD